MKQTSIKQMLFGTSPIHMKQKLSKVATALLFTFCLALLPKAQAVNPKPGGGYPGGNTAAGQSALLNLTTGTYNTAVGALSLGSITTGNFNTATGAGTLLVNIADQNTATGAAALLSNTTGAQNTATGSQALLGNTTGNQNTATGASALADNTTGFSNTATGSQALLSNTTGGDNTADGTGALLNNTIGNNNTASGVDALLGNTIGINNTATGSNALVSNTDGSYNTANGFRALYVNTTGGSNVANGVSALVNNTTGSLNTAIGMDAGFAQTSGINNVYIGANMAGVAGESNACYIASIFGQTSASGIPVLINSNGKLGTMTSSRRFKEEIKPMEQASEALLALKPVTFRYKKEIDPQGVPQFGLVAEEVEKVNPKLVVRDKDGKVNTVRYEAVNAMLLNEFLKEHKKVEDQQATITELKSTVAQQKKGMEILTAQLKEQGAQIQKVTAQIEMSRPASRVVANKP